MNRLDESWTLNVQDAAKHVSSEDRTKWDGMGDRVTTAETKPEEPYCKWQSRTSRILNA
ncbi:hypothetical protein [Bacillus amyloliquefaciens]|uniref:hypothetical protein n=1 Tax=Bacillus amyloliquefaciens TaxID=1390 RepID=UPI0012D9F26D|nr:hypothetical protein [Bacillus amyloliquefaciens]